jgi:hypothetical protein
MLGAGGPVEINPRVAWPLHVALRELHESSGRTGTRELIGVELKLGPCPDVGIRVRGADEGVQRLLRGGILGVRGTSRDSRLVVSDANLVKLRRSLLSEDPARVDLLQRAAKRWAALCCTAEKNRDNASRSSGSTVASAIPNLAKEECADRA